MFKKILIANRGEIALRIIRTAKEMGIKTVAVYSTADKYSLHVYFADEAVCIGPPYSYQSYLNVPNLISAAEITNADAIHPGYGFLSESAYFSSMCRKHKIKFIGPSPNQIIQMGNKISAKKTMKNAGISCLPGSDCCVESSYKEVEKIAEKIGYPIIIKAVYGGGGKGIRSVLDKKELKKSWEEAKKEALACFGKTDMYIEKLIIDPRHIEIQIISDRYGKSCHLSERDCSIQRRNQKLVEEAPSPFLTISLRKKMGEEAVKAAEFIHYEGIGTIEFLVDKNKNFYFMEMNPRIQVEHTITEEITGLDLVQEQIFLAYGKKISGKNYYPKMYSIECRINAEEPYQDFRPVPGKIIQIHFPGGKGVRIDTHIYAGYRVPHHYDSMIAKIITTAKSRKETIEKMQRSLEELLIEGIRTTIPFHRQLMQNNDFLKGNYHTNFLKKLHLDSKFDNDHSNY
ncbi:acetyl-CoA carboxylase biotin carboxylase subunit [Blattabacterium punctulatus]|uniref:acetyl-CoA carboxylase biotin carboxylase subunit n=1 Tax=Blattabacterium punctulatus TaxID=164514 RepID=UPI000D7CCCCE|nr:acetyl-CoA carboxylase biotin carboxylase subunit [Blattabacterium punctulatus]AWU43350.1 acetyl-CoA carboxylase biotin carboxylase subunit [Blattabacterium punctulatus]AWU46087.1 acetyl-CoA carboxylase biotin carboxylase subunit [Blattabacterium punctulatus]